MFDLDLETIKNTLNNAKEIVGTVTSLVKPKRTKNGFKFSKSISKGLKASIPAGGTAYAAVGNDPIVIGSVTLPAWAVVFIGTQLVTMVQSFLKHRK